MDDVVKIGSDTKSFNLVLNMQLQKEALLSPEDKTSEWLLELACELPTATRLLSTSASTQVGG